MRCPKCGTEQPESDTCVSCQIVISKYMKMMEARSAPTMFEPAPQAQPVKKPSRLGTVLKAVVVLAIIAGAAFSIKWYKEEYSVKGRLVEPAVEAGAAQASYGSIETREYVNRHFGFKLSIPVNWKVFTVDEAVSCGIIRRRDGEDFYLITGPWQRPVAALYVMKPVESDLFNGMDWRFFVAS